MAETIDYKVRIDTSGVADQLQNIKNQVDQAMATYNWRTRTPDPQPQAFAFPYDNYTGGGTTPSYISPTIAAGQAIDTGAQQAYQASRNILETSRLGFQKFTQDVQNAALITSIGRAPSLANYGEPLMPDFSDNGTFRREFEALTGWGYNPHMSMTYGAYSRYAQNAFGDNLTSSIVSAMNTTGNVLGGVALASTIFGTGALAATLGPAGMVLGAAPILTQDALASANINAYTRDTSWRFLSGRLSRGDTERIAAEATHMGRTPELVGYGMGLSDVQQTIKTYTEAGGFDMVRNASEFADAMKTIVGSIAQGAQTMRMSREDYATFHAQMSKFGMVPNAASALGLQQVIAGQALAAGYTPAEMIQFGMQSAEMVRGTGISMGTAFMGGIGALADIKAMARSGDISIETLNQLNGAENAAATMNRVGYGWANSAAGFTQFAAESYYGRNAAGMGLTNMMSGAIGRITSPMEFLRFQGSMAARISGKSGEELFLDDASMYMQQLKMLADATGEPIDKNLWMGYMKGRGIDTAQSTLMWEAGTSRNFGAIDFLNNTTRETLDQRGAPIQRIVDKIGNELAESWPVQVASSTVRGLTRAVTDIGYNINDTYYSLFYGYTPRRTARIAGAETSRFWENPRGYFASPVNLGDANDTAKQFGYKNFHEAAMAYELEDTKNPTFESNAVRVYETGLLDKNLNMSALEAHKQAILDVATWKNTGIAPYSGREKIQGNTTDKERIIDYLETGATIKMKEVLAKRFHTTFGSTRKEITEAVNKLGPEALSDISYVTPTEFSAMSKLKSVNEGIWSDVTGAFAGHAELILPRLATAFFTGAQKYRAGQQAIQGVMQAQSTPEFENQLNENMTLDNMKEVFSSNIPKSAKDEETKSLQLGTEEANRRMVDTLDNMWRRMQNQGINVRITNAYQTR